MSTLPDFTGKWLLVKTENFEKFAHSSGDQWLVSSVMQTDLTDRLTLEVTQIDENRFTFKSDIPPMIHENHLIIGQETEKNCFGISIKTTSFWQENMLATRMEIRRPEQTDDENHNYEENESPQFLNFTREIDGEGDMIQTIWVGKQKARRIFRKIGETAKSLEASALQEELERNQCSVTMYPLYSKFQKT